MKSVLKHKNHSKTADTASYPRWDLTTHFKFMNIMDPKLDEAVEEVLKLSISFKDMYEGKLDASAEILLKSIEDFEDLSTKSHFIQSYLYLEFATKQDEDEVSKRESFLTSKLSDCSSNNLTFYNLEVAGIPQEKIDDFFQTNPKGVNHDLIFYRPFVQEIRKYHPYLLTKDVERALGIRSSWSGADPVITWYDTIMSTATFSFRGEHYQMSTLLKKMLDPSPSVRREVLKVFNDGLKTNKIDEFSALSLNLVSGSWYIEMKERNYPTLRTRRNIANDVDDETVNSLLSACRNKGTELCKRYYLLKKRVLKVTQKLKEFTWADRNAPLGLKGSKDVISWEEAVQQVRSSFEEFSPTFTELFDMMVTEKRIDVPTRKGKRGGAFCHGVVPGVGPFQLLNFEGTVRDVATLAHESGHGCHFALSYEVGTLMMNPPLTIAECASTFGEMVVFRNLLSKRSQAEKLDLLMQKMDDIINTVVRQCSFDMFEESAHMAREKGKVNIAEYSDLWMKATVAFYGKEGEVFDKYDDMDSLWSYVSHFHHVPFYVYAYAFADLVVGSLHGVYQKEPEGFELKFLDFLRSGGTKNFKQLLEPFNLDPSQPSFWEDALENYLGSLLSETEALAQELGY